MSEHEENENGDDNGGLKTESETGIEEEKERGETDAAERTRLTTELGA